MMHQTAKRICLSIDTKLHIYTTFIFFADLTFQTRDPTKLRPTVNQIYTNNSELYMQIYFDAKNQRTNRRIVTKGTRMD